MKKEYDFSHARPNPYAKRLKRSVTIRLDEATIAYFKDLAAETGIAYQTLINSYLRDCATSRRRLTMRWIEPKKGVLRIARTGRLRAQAHEKIRSGSRRNVPRGRKPRA